MNQAGVKVGLGFDGDNMIRKDVQDISTYLEDNRRERIDGENEQRGASARKFASVPVIILQKLKDQLGIDYNLFGTCPDHTGRFIAWLNENPDFRTSEAKLANGNRYVR